MKSADPELETLLLPKPKKRYGNHLVTFLTFALLVHVIAYIWISKYSKTILKKPTELISISILKEPPPPPKPKPPPPKPKPIATPKPAAAPPLLHIEQVKFHATKKPSETQKSNLQEVEESHGGSKYGNPEGTPGGKGNIEDTGKSTEPPPPPPPPPPKPKPTIPDRKDPLVTNRCQPPYPDMERDQGVEGTVRLLVTVGSSGQVADVNVIGSSGNVELDNAAVSNVRGCWRFSPAIQNGHPVESNITFSIVFRLQ